MYPLRHLWTFYRDLLIFSTNYSFCTNIHVSLWCWIVDACHLDAYVMSAFIFTLFGGDIVIFVTPFLSFLFIWFTPFLLWFKCQCALYFTSYFTLLSIHCVGNHTLRHRMVCLTSFLFFLPVNGDGNNFKFSGVSLLFTQDRLFLS